MKQKTKIPLYADLEKASIRDMRIIFIEDTATSKEAVKDALAKGFGELMQYIKSHRLQPKRYMIWYNSMKPPWRIEMAVETESLNAGLSGRVQSRILNGGEVIIAHIRGPYDQVHQGYEKIQYWLKENNRKARGNPYEVYLHDPGIISGRTEIQTDIYQPI